MLSYLQFTLEQTYGQSTIISGFFWTGLLKRLDQNEDGFIALSNIAIFQLDMVISIAPRDLQVAAIQNSLISIENRNSHQCKNETKVTTCFLFSIRKISFVQIVNDLTSTPYIDCGFERLIYHGKVFNCSFSLLSNMDKVRMKLMQKESPAVFHMDGE